MTENFKFDLLVKVIGSILYRVVIILYSIFLILRYENVFPLFLYFGLIVIYVVLIFYLLNRDGLRFRLRLLLDITLIFFVLYGKNIDSMVCLFLLTFPIINSPNQVGRTYTMFLLFLAVYVLYFILGGNFNYESIIFIQVLQLIYVFGYYRTRALNFYYSLIKSVSELYESDKKYDDEEELYEVVVKRFNINRFKSMFGLNKIIYLKKREDGYIIQGSSRFISKVTISDYEKFIEKSVSGEVFSDFNIEVEDISYKDTYIVPIRENKDVYSIFILLVNSNKHIANFFPKVRDKYFLTPILVPFFRQLATFFDSEHFIKKDRLDKFKKIKGEYNYVLKTINVVHFLRNKLTPFKNLLEMSTDVVNDKSLAKEKIEELKIIISEQREMSKTALNEILSRVNNILDYSENPFNVTSDIGFVKIHELFSQLRRLVFDSFHTDAVVSEIEIQEFDSLVSVSKKGISIVFSDLINNMFKYCPDHCSCRIVFRMVNKVLEIDFVNSYDKKYISDIKKFVKYIESDDNYNIFKMATKGAFLLKHFLSQMEVGVKAFTNEKESNFHFILQLNIKS